MKGLRILLVVVVIFSLLFVMGCAKRKMVKPTQEPVVDDMLAEVEDFDELLDPPMDEPMEDTVIRSSGRCCLKPTGIRLRIRT